MANTTNTIGLRGLIHRRSREKTDAIGLETRCYGDHVKVRSIKNMDRQKDSAVK
jgi:hypothetical protein